MIYLNLFAKYSAYISKCDLKFDKKSIPITIEELPKHLLRFST